MPLPSEQINSDYDFCDEDEEEEISAILLTNFEEA